MTKRSTRTTTTIGVIIAIFGVILSFASYNLIQQLSQALDLCTSTLACPGTLSGGSVYSNVYTALLWTVVIVALGLGTTIGGIILAYNGKRKREAVTSVSTIS